MYCHTHLREEKFIINYNFKKSLNELVNKVEVLRIKLKKV